MPKQYPQWIDEHALVTYHAFRSVGSANWGPLDAWRLVSFLDGTFLGKIYDALTDIKRQGYQIPEVAKSFSSLSGLREDLWWLMLEYKDTQLKDKAKFREVLEYFLELLCWRAKRDVWAQESNIGHTEEEITQLLDAGNWQKGDREIAQVLGKLYAVLDGFAHTTFGDLFTEEACEVYGPYDASKRFGQGTILLIKHFPQIKPVELWPQLSILPYSEIKLSQVYRNVKFRCEIIGMYSIYEGDPLDNLVAYEFLVDGKPIASKEEIKKLAYYFGDRTVEHSSAFGELSKEDLKKKILETLCHKYIGFFKLAGTDWKPTAAMLAQVRDKYVPERITGELFSFSYEDYVASPKHEVYWLKDLYK